MPNIYEELQLVLGFIAYMNIIKNGFDFNHTYDEDTDTYEISYRVNGQSVNEQKMMLSEINFIEEILFTRTGFESYIIAEIA